MTLQLIAAIIRVLCARILDQLSTTAAQAHTHALMADPDTESLTPEHEEKPCCRQCGTTRASSYGHSGLSCDPGLSGLSCDRCAFLSLVGSGAATHPDCPPRPPPETGVMAALDATVDAWMVDLVLLPPALADSFAAQRAAAGDSGEFYHMMELALTEMLGMGAWPFVWVKHPDLPPLNMSRLGMVIDAAAAASHVGVSEVPVRLVPAQLSSSAWLSTMELCLNVVHLRPATQQEVTDAVKKALEAGWHFENRPFVPTLFYSLSQQQQQDYLENAAPEWYKRFAAAESDQTRDDCAEYEKRLRVAYQAEVGDRVQKYESAMVMELQRRCPPRPDERLKKEQGEGIEAADNELEVFVKEVSNTHKPRVFPATPEGDRDAHATLARMVAPGQRLATLLEQDGLQALGKKLRELAEPPMGASGDDAAQQTRGEEVRAVLDAWQEMAWSRNGVKRQ